MILDTPRAAMARAFRETVLCLVGVFRVYEVDHELADATADTLGRVFRRHLARVTDDDDFGPPRCALHALADELDRAVGD